VLFAACAGPGSIRRRFLWSPDTASSRPSLRRGSNRRSSRSETPVKKGPAGPAEGSSAHDAVSVAAMRSSPLDDASSSASSIAPRAPLSEDACDPGERFAMLVGSCHGLLRGLVRCRICLPDHH